mmetsp:Transcript_10821/g.16625  ORF Transcript_10821/g.16625 Transcript_10821/m.16625 type:complete len:285 (-) Transcript_10821:61-915(-)
MCNIYQATNNTELRDLFQSMKHSPTSSLRTTHKRNTRQQRSKRKQLEEAVFTLIAEDEKERFFMRKLKFKKGNNASKRGLHDVDDDKAPLPRKPSRGAPKNDQTLFHELLQNDPWMKRSKGCKNNMNDQVSILNPVVSCQTNNLNERKKEEESPQPVTVPDDDDSTVNHYDDEQFDHDETSLVSQGKFVPEALDLMNPVSLDVMTCVSVEADDILNVQTKLFDEDEAFSGELWNSLNHIESFNGAFNCVNGKQRRQAKYNKYRNLQSHNTGDLPKIISFETESI